MMGINAEFLTDSEITDTGYTGNIYNDILNVTTEHPLREDQLADLIKKDRADNSIVTSLIEQRLIRAVLYNGKKYYLREYHFNV